MTEAAQHQDADRLERIAAGLPPDVHDPATVEAYAALAKRPAKAKAASPKPTKKGGGSSLTPRCG
jgi:hypothetical protein